MTPQEKAIELVNKFPLNGLILEYGDAPKQYKEHAKRCAKIAVDLLLDEMFFEDEPIYWIQVKEEIEKL